MSSYTLIRNGVAFWLGLIVLQLASLAAIGMATPASAQKAGKADSSLREYGGTIKPIQTFVFSARFDALLKKVHYAPGELVNEGSLVFEFASAGKEFAFDRSRAQRQRMEAELRGAENTLQRYRKLGKTEAIAAIRIEDAEIARAVAAAKLKDAQAAEKIAALVVAHMKLRAPFTGIMGEARVAEGTFIDPVSRTAKPLGQIVRMDPIWVVGKVPFEVFYESRMATENESAALKKAKLTLILPNGAAYPHAGKAKYSDYEIDAATQTVVVWAVFPNPDFILRPGLNVKVRSRWGAGE